MSSLSTFDKKILKESFDEYNKKFLDADPREVEDEIEDVKRQIGSLLASDRIKLLKEIAYAEAVAQNHPDSEQRSVWRSFAKSARSHIEKLAKAQMEVKVSVPKVNTPTFPLYKPEELVGRMRSDKKDLFMAAFGDVFNKYERKPEDANKEEKPDVIPPKDLNPDIKKKEEKEAKRPEKEKK